MHFRDNAEERESVVKEVKLLKSLHHRNITKLIDDFFVNDYYCIVMEYARHRSL